jgi:opacity protein-like surface antigen
MKFLKVFLLAGVMLAPIVATAHAADPYADDAPAAADPALVGLYLRGDLGWSFLEWDGGADDSTFVAGGGVGYRYNESFRADVTLDWSGDYDIGAGNEISTAVVLGNLYFDFDNDTMFTPYVGAGAGYGFVEGSGVPDDDGFAFGVAAGVSVDLTNNISVDTGYRFRDIMISGSDTQEHQITTGLRFSF